MRKSFQSQGRLDCPPIDQVPLNVECRDEIVPILAGLQHCFSHPPVRQALTDLVAEDLNRDSRRDIGRSGFDDWQVVVLSTVRLGCNLDYDKLQDQAENHRTLRSVMGIGDWDDSTSFNWRRIRNTLCQLQAATIEKMNAVIVAHGQELHGAARHVVRADSFVTETNIHYPTESQLIWDGVQKIVPLCVQLAAEVGVSGWRQSKHLKKRIKAHVRAIAQISASKSRKVKDGLAPAYEKLLNRVTTLIERAKSLQIVAETEGDSVQSLALSKRLLEWIELTEQVCDTAHRRVLLKEKVPNADKLFSLFEEHTQLYQRGKAGEPIQFGRQVLVFEDAAGFISHYHVMDRDATDADVIVEQTREVQAKHQGEIEKASFDRGFYSPNNEEELREIVAHPCVPPRHPKQYAERIANASVEFQNSRQRHPGIESAIGALQSGNGLKRCRDRSEVGLERYVGLAVLGRNLHVLGKILIAQRNSKAKAAVSKRNAA